MARGIWQDLKSELEKAKQETRDLRAEAGRFIEHYFDGHAVCKNLPDCWKISIDVDVNS